MICPNCRHETPGTSCEHCGQDRSDALRRAAESAEGELNWKRGYRHWSELLEAEAGDPQGLRGRARCGVRGILDRSLPESFEAVERMLWEALDQTGDWEEGFELQWALYGHTGSLERLAEEYESPRRSRPERAKVARLTLQFAGKKFTPPPEEGPYRPWVKWVTLTAGIALVWVGGDLIPNRLMGDKPLSALVPLMMIVFGLAFSVGSAIVVWRTPPQNRDKPKKEEHP